MVDEIGASVQGPQVGDRVMVPFNIFCGSCWCCARGLCSHCHDVDPNATAVGGIYGDSHTTGGYDGGQAEYAPTSGTSPRRHRAGRSCGHASPVGAPTRTRPTGRPPRSCSTPAATGARWDFPERQPGAEGRERSIEHAFATPVFGTAQPLHGSPARSAATPTAGAARAGTRTGCCSSGQTGSTPGAATCGRPGSLHPDDPVTESGVLGELSARGSSRSGRSDRRHQVLDPVVVAGPWMAGAGRTLLGVRRVLHPRRR